LKAGKYISIACLVWSIVSCGHDKNALTPEERYSVDTIFNNQLSAYRKELDSICKAEKDTLFARTVDSLKTEGMKEIEALIMKNHLTE
jgi:hypothetical protein